MEDDDRAQLATAACATDETRVSASLSFDRLQPTHATGDERQCAGFRAPTTELWQQDRQADGAILRQIGGRATDDTSAHSHRNPNGDISVLQEAADGAAVNVLEWPTYNYDILVAQVTSAFERGELTPAACDTAARSLKNMRQSLQRGEPASGLPSEAAAAEQIDRVCAMKLQLFPLAASG